MLAQAAELVAAFEATSVTALLHAACSSPTARQAMTSCAALLMSSWASRPTGSRVATEEDLAPLVGELRAACPDLAAVEDFVPLDPRRRVHFRAASDGRSWDFRVHPGGLESPLQALQAVVNYAEAVDPVLLPRFGYGVADMLQVAGRMLDAELALLAPMWGGQEVSLESVPVVTAAEVAAAADYLDMWRPSGVLPAGLAALRDEHDAGPLGRTARGLAIDYQRLSFGAGPDQAHVGPALFVRGPAGVLPVPSALIIESLTAAAHASLYFLSADSDVPDKEPEPGRRPRDPAADIPRVTAAEAAEAARRWQERAGWDLEWACRALPATILFGTLADEGHELLLIGPGHRHVIVIDLVAGLNFREINDSIRSARQRLAGFGPGSSFRVSPGDHQVRSGGVPSGGPPPPGTTDPGMAWRTGTADAIPFPEPLMTGEAAALAPGTVVTRLVVVDGPWQHGPIWVPEIPVCTLDEFRSLLASQDWQSADREELWSFLDELASLGSDDAGSGYAELVCWSILDAWEAWQAIGMLCPAWIDRGTCGRILPRDLDYAWERDAFLDGVDAVLASLEMSGAREWSQLIPTPVPAALAGSDEMSFVVTLSMYAPRRVWWVAADMGLVVRADLEFRDGLVFSRAVMGTLADALADTLREVARQHPHAWQLWREAHGEHPVVIQLTPAQLPEGMPALRFVGLGERDDQLFADPQRLAELPGADLHVLMGEALTFGLLARLQSERLADLQTGNPAQGDSGAEEQGTGSGEPDPVLGSGRVIEVSPSDEDIRRAEIFSAAWQDIPPRLDQRSSTAPFRPYELTASQTLTLSGHDRARRTIARRLRSNLSPGTHPLRAVLTELCPGALDALTAAASGYAPRAALAAACAELERALNDRFASRTSLEMNLGSSWAAETIAELDVAASSDEMRRYRTAELLVERLLSQPPTGSLVPDRRDVHHLLDLASAALEASLDAQYAYAAVRPAELAISGFGDINIEPTGPECADIRTWQQAQLETQAQAVRSGESRSPDHAGMVAADSDDLDHEDGNQQLTLRSLLEKDRRTESGFPALNAHGLLEVDDQLLEHCGFTLDSLVAVLAAVTSWDVPAEPDPPIAQVSRDALVDDVIATSGLPREQVDAAIRACTLSAEQIQEEGHRYWQLRERTARLALRPLIEPLDTGGTGELWLLPRCAHRTQQLLLTYLNGQQLPWPDQILPSPVRQAAKAWHKLAEDHLETELGIAARSAGLAYRPNLKENKARREGLTLHGEIDLLAADALRRRIWIIEAKHLRQVFSPLEIGFRIADFHGKAAVVTGPDTYQFRQFQSRTFTPYADRVLANTRAIDENRHAAIRLISAVSPESNLVDENADDWEIIPLIVTTHVEISAFVTDPRVPFVLIDNLGKLLTADDCPPPGWWRP